jgi:RimJ/RimL family protein N-acetyltransferase
VDGRDLEGLSAVFGKDEVWWSRGLPPPEFLPEVMPTVEIGWRLDPEYRGRGLAREGAAAALTHGFVDLAIPEVVSIYRPDDPTSGRVMERLGMHFDRDTRHPRSGSAARLPPRSS